MDEYLRVDLVTFEKATVETNEKYSATIFSYSYLNNKTGQLLRKDGSFSPLTIESGEDLSKKGFAGCVFEINRFFYLLNETDLYCVSSYAQWGNFYTMKQLTESEKNKFIKFLLPQAIALDSQGVEYDRALYYGAVIDSYNTPTFDLIELDGFY